MPRPPVICAATILAVLALPGAARAEPTAQLAASRLTLKPGATARISVRVHATSACTLRIGRRVATVATDGIARVAYTFRIAARTRVRSARATIACAPLAAQTVTLRIAPRRRAGATASLIAGPIRKTVTAAQETPGGAAPPGPVAGPAEVAALARAQADWDAGEAEWMAMWRNGQCTDWTQRKRPDIVERVTVAMWAAEFLGRPVTPLNWNGGFWDETAAAYGLAVGTVPRAGAIATFDAGVMGAGKRGGHAAYVESVGSEAFTVSEMNAPALGEVSERTIRTADLAPNGVAFIY